MKNFRRNLLVHVLPITLLMLVMAFAMVLVNLSF